MLWLPSSMDGAGGANWPRRRDRCRRVPLRRARLHPRRATAAAVAHRRAAGGQPPRPVPVVLPPHRLAQGRRRTDGHDGPCDDAGHAPRRAHLTAAADRWTRPIPSSCAPRCATRARGRSGTGTSPLPLLRPQDPGQRPDALCRMRDGTPLAMLGFSTAAWKLAPRDRFVGWTPELRERNLTRRRQPALPDPAQDPHPQPRLAHPRRRPPAAARGLGGRLQHDPGADRDLRRDPAPHRRRPPGVRLDPRRHHPGTRVLRHDETLREAE